jgi:hypothetical protein
MTGLCDLPLELKKLLVDWAIQMDISNYSRMQMPAGTEKIGITIYANGNAPKGTSQPSHPWMKLLSDRLNAYLLSNWTDYHLRIMF